MPLFAQQPTSAANYWIMAIELAFILATIYVWLSLCSRYLSGQPVLPTYRPRRLAPWKGVDLLLIYFVYVLVVFTIQFGAFFLKNSAGREIDQSEENRPIAEQKEKTTEHPAAQLAKNKDPRIFALNFIVAVAIAPIFEEFIFRALLLGWLEAVERRRIRRLSRFFRCLPQGILPIVLSSLLFAWPHFRSESPAAEESNLILIMSVTGLVSLLVFAFSLVWLHRHSGATARDFGWDAERFWGDVVLGFSAFLAVAVPIYALQIDLATYILPEKYAPDPITLFFFAVVLGLLYYRTHRIVPSIVLHALLNASSLALAWSG
jgi:membrane protease YdiL (CAAX protease family)